MRFFVEGNIPSFPYRVSLCGNNGALPFTRNSDDSVEKIVLSAYE